MCGQPALLSATLRFLTPVNYWREAKKMDNNKSCKIEKEKEMVLIMICMFFFVKHLPCLGNTYP